MQDFAALVLDARTRLGLTQAQVAEAAGFTPSYLSFIENRKKPPPSDEACGRLAAVLNLPVQSLLEAAHMERAPEALRKRVRTLTHSLRRERKSRRRALESLLSPFLFRGPPGYLEAAIETLSISHRRRKRIREVLAAVGRHNIRSEKQVSRIVDDLPERERALLLEALPELLDRSGAAEAQRKATTGLPAGADDTAPGAGGTSESDAGVPWAGTSPRLLYAPPPLDGEQPHVPYLLEATEEAARAFDEVRPGDLLLVDPNIQPVAGDLVVVRGEQGFGLRRLVEESGGFSLVGGTSRRKAGAGTDRLDRESLATRLAQVGGGTVIEVRRPLRRGSRPRDRA